MNTIFEEHGGTYIPCGDYLIPDLLLPEGSVQPIGKYGRMRMKYLKEHRTIIFSQLVLSGKLTAHLVEIDQTCQKRMNQMISKMKRTEGVTEALKAENQMEWVRKMNSIHHRAEEMILNELIYN